MTPADRVAVAFSLALILLSVALETAGVIDMDYNPFAGLEWPSFALGSAVIAMSCAWPALVLLFAPRPGPVAQQGQPLETGVAQT
jgi:hypothetical protein